MKRALPLCLACLMSLAACSAQGAVVPAVSPSASQPVETPAVIPALVQSIPIEAYVSEGTEWDDLSALPQRLVDGQAGLSRYMMEPSATVLLAQLPEKEVALYGVWDEEHPEEQSLLRIGEHAWLYDLQWATPRCYLPQLHSGDFDGDGFEELALLFYVGSGTGVSYWTLGIVELDGDAPTLRAVFAHSYEDTLDPYFSCDYNAEGKEALLSFNNSEPETIDFSDFTPPLPADAQLVAAVGDIVEYTVEGDAITVHLGVNLYGDDIPRTCLYPADIEAQVVYDGESFSLFKPTMHPGE